MSPHSPFLLWSHSPVRSLSLALVWRARLSRLTLKKIFCFAFQKHVELAEFLIIWQIKVAQQANISLWLQRESNSSHAFWKHDANCTRGLWQAQQMKLRKFAQGWFLGQRDHQLERATQRSVSLGVHRVNHQFILEKIQVYFKKTGERSGKAKLEELVSHTHSRVSFLKG